MMKTFLSLVGILSVILISAQTEEDTLKQKKIEEVTIIAKKPTVESKADRTVFNVAESSILAGNTTWDVLQMTPMVTIENDEDIKTEGETVTVYINDRKSIFTGKELKEYLKTIPADNLMKIEVITSPSARYEASGAVINIVLKKMENEGLKGSFTVSDRQFRKNSQYSNVNLNYHKKNFTQSFTGSYNDNTSVNKQKGENYYYEDESTTQFNSESIYESQAPSFSSSSELELNDKNNLGLVLEYGLRESQSTSDVDSETYIGNALQDSYIQDQYSNGKNQNAGANMFYKYYDKEKNKILDVNLVANYNSWDNTNNFTKDLSSSSIPQETRIDENNEEREYYLKVDYTQPIGKSEDKKGANIEFGGKVSFKNNVIPNGYSGYYNGSLESGISRFKYLENLNSLYANFSKTFFEKLETRIGLRFENIQYTIKQNDSNINQNIEQKDSYNTWLPDVLLKYKISDLYDLTATYNHDIWRPWYSEFNPFETPSNNGIYYRGNMDLQPNPSDRFNLKLGIHKKYFISASYWFTNQDYWNDYFDEGDKTVNMPTNFDGRVERYSLNFNTNQTFIKDKFNVNLNLYLNYSDNSDFNNRNDIEAKNYITNLNGTANLTYKVRARPQQQAGAGAAGRCRGLGRGQLQRPGGRAAGGLRGRRPRDLNRPDRVLAL